jgi:hypothetical protein
MVKNKPAKIMILPKDSLVPEVETIFKNLDGKIKYFYGFPENWKDDVRRIVAEVLYDSCVRRGVRETIELGEEILERNDVWMTSKHFFKSKTGKKIPIWKAGPFEGGPALKKVLMELFDGDSDRRNRISGRTASEGREKDARKITDGRKTWRRLIDCVRGSKDSP